MAQFTTITDVTNYLYGLDPAFNAELTEDQMQDIVREHRVNRYEDITDDELNAMYEAALAACLATA